MFKFAKILNMKSYKSLILIAVCSIFLTTSCSKSAADADPVVQSQSNMSATIAGVSWASIPDTAIASINQSSFGGQQMSLIQIAGFSLDQKNLSIQFPLTSIGVGTYNFTSSSDGGLVYSSSPTANGLYTSNNGTGSCTLNITNFDIVTGRLSGNFSGTVFNQNGSSLIITNGLINNVKIISSGFYSNGTMSLKLNNGSLLTMDSDSSDGKFLMISQNSVNNDLALFGYNSNLTATDAGVYFVQVPKNAVAGTYNVINNANYKVGIGNKNNEPAYTVSIGSITITSNVNKNIVGTFNYTASNGVAIKTVSSGSLNFTFN